MTGPEHYRQAERLIEQADEWPDADLGWKGDLTAAERIARRDSDLAAAQVHATLALAAATGLNDAYCGKPDHDHRAWLDVARTSAGA